MFQLSKETFPFLLFLFLSFFELGGNTLSICRLRGRVERGLDLLKFIRIKLLVFQICVGRKLLIGLIMLRVWIDLLLIRLRFDQKLLIVLLFLGFWFNDWLHNNRDCWLFCLFFFIFFYYINYLRRRKSLFFQRWLNYNTWQWERVLNLLFLCWCFLLFYLILILFWLLFYLMNFFIIYSILIIILKRI